MCPLKQRCCLCHGMQVKGTAHMCHHTPGQRVTYITAVQIVVVCLRGQQGKHNNQLRNLGAGSVCLEDSGRFTCYDGHKFAANLHSAERALRNTEFMCTSMYNYDLQ